MPNLDRFAEAMPWEYTKTEPDPYEPVVEYRTDLEQVKDLVGDMLEAKTIEELDEPYHELTELLVGMDKPLEDVDLIYKSMRKRMDKLHPIFSEILNNFKGAIK
jgi:hypothetical protein